MLMKTIKLLFVTVLIAALGVSCNNTVYVEDDYIEPGISLNELIHSYEIWYVDLNESDVYEEIPFMQIAFTLSFRNGVLYANNNLAGLGTTGNGFGIDVGYYDAYNTTLQIDHDIDGVWNFNVQQLSANKIRLYNYTTDSYYVLEGYQRSNFDYDYVFYDNIHYFLQEYEAWEKVYTSQEGAINEFDAENYLAFLSEGYGDTFLSSTDPYGLAPSQIYWDYEGIYEIQDIAGDPYAKVLTLDYDFLDNEYFELYVINDETIELYHPYSQTTYRFKGRGFIEFMRPGTTAKGNATKQPRKRSKENNKIFEKENFKSLVK